MKGCEAVVKVLWVSGTRWGLSSGGGHTGTADGLNTPLYPAMGPDLGGNAHISPHAAWRKVCLQSPVPRL